MRDLIDRQAVIEWLKAKDIIKLSSQEENAKRELRELISVNPQEPKTIQEKQAESEKYEKAYDDGYKNGYAQARFDYEQESKTGHWEWLTEDKYRCSNCNHETRVDECMNEPMYSFCPFCGADMSAKAESEEV